MFPQFVISHLDISKPSIVQFSYRGDEEYSLAGVNVIDDDLNKFYYTS